jgi:hypothetical protein
VRRRQQLRIIGYFDKQDRHTASRATKHCRVVVKEPSRPQPRLVVVGASIFESKHGPLKNE